MKRIRINTNMEYENMTMEEHRIPQELNEANQKIQLLYDVPLSYLVPDESFLPPESIRFFFLDENYITAMLNGVTSIGRTTLGDKKADSVILQAAVSKAKKGLWQIRKSKVHANHHKMLENVKEQFSGVRTGFLMRSALVRNKKGIVVCGFQGKEPLAALRLDLLAADIMIGIFDGEMDCLTIAEPACGLRFGFHSGEKRKEMLSIKEPGALLKDSFIEKKTNGRGRLDVLGTVQQMNRILRQNGEIEKEISSHEFAYELLLASQKAELLKKERGK